MLRRTSIAALAGLAIHYCIFQIAGVPLLTDTVAEWIMARTPSRYAVWILQVMGVWAKPFAATGGLAALGATLLLAASVPRFRVPVGASAALALCTLLDYRSALGAAAFWVPAMSIISRVKPARLPQPAGRRGFLLSSVMGIGTFAVAAESYLRNESLSRRAVAPVQLHPFRPPAGVPGFAHVRRLSTSVDEFYGMSKNTVDPAVDPASWRLRFTLEGKPLAEFGYSELLALPRTQRWVTLRCISNTLQSDLMGNALWSGLLLKQLAGAVPEGCVEAAVIGVDGHGDSYPIDYLFSNHAMLALGMNGRTLNRTHGFPMRLLVPRYYGFKNVKWISEIRFVRKPYFGTWPKMGYTKEAIVHTCSHIDRVLKTPDGLLVGGVSFAGDSGIRHVEVRAGRNSWVPAELESPLSPYSWTRWRALLPVTKAEVVEARAQDGSGAWQADRESNLYPSGVSGPTIRKVSL